MNQPKPAVVTERAARRLPRMALLLLCAAYTIPGFFGRDPWRQADITAFGYMHSVATGRSQWWHPLVGGLPPEGGLFPYWLGAFFIRLLDGVVDPALAARIPFGLLLVAVLALTWYATYHLARTEAAQPVAFAFGGEAQPTDYARAVADGALLALLASLGLLQLGHETTPELLQLTGAAMLVYALAAADLRAAKSKLAVLVALPLMAGSGAPATALALGAGGTVICLLSSQPEARRFAGWVALAATLAVLMGVATGTWAWRIYPDPSARQVLRLFAWFMWPAWPLAAWTLWRWRGHLLRRHLAVPLMAWAVAAVACVAMNGSDRALMLGLPPLAVLAAFSLPTLRRGMASAIDWFSVFFFSVGALAVWVIYLSMQVGVPAKPLANIQRLAPGFEPQFSWWALLPALLATLAWVWLVRWRAKRHRVVLWRSLVLPAGGVALCWLLLLTLCLPVLDYARSERPLVARLSQHLTREDCVAVRHLPKGQIAALEALGGYRVVPWEPLSDACPQLLVVAGGRPPAPEGWSLVGRERRPTDRSEFTYIYHRVR